MHLAAVALGVTLVGGASPSASPDPLAYTSLKRLTRGPDASGVVSADVAPLVKECVGILDEFAVTQRTAVRRRFALARKGKDRPVLLLESGWVTGESYSYAYALVEGDRLVRGLARPPPMAEYVTEVPDALRARVAGVREGLPAKARGALHVEVLADHHGCWMLTLLTRRGVQQTAVYGMDPGGAVASLIDALLGETEGVYWDYETVQDFPRPEAEPANPRPVPEWPLEPRGYGPVRTGMTLAEASRALGRDLDPGPLDDDERACHYGKPIDEPILRDVAFMFVDDHLVRVEVGGAKVRTTEGAGVGTPEDELLRLYPNARVTEHPYTDGHYVTVPVGGYGYVFETDGTKVTKYRAGEPGPVTWWEGCQ